MRMEEIGAISFLTFLLFVAGVAGGLLNYCTDGREEKIRSEAIERGLAEYVIVDQQTGATE